MTDVEISFGVPVGTEMNLDRMNRLFELGWDDALPVARGEGNLFLYVRIDAEDWEGVARARAETLVREMPDLDLRAIRLDED